MFPLLFALIACEPETEVEVSTISFLSPAVDEEVAVGDVDVSVIVEHFTLADPKHGAEDGVSVGYIVVSLDDSEEQNFGSTNFTVAVDAAGEHTLTAELVYEDGDSLDEPATARVTFTAVDP